MSRFVINLNAVTSEAYLAIRNLDASFVGTADYLGVAYFWHYDYRFLLRSATVAERVRVHRALVDTGLPVDGASALHNDIIHATLGPRALARLAAL